MPKLWAAVGGRMDHRKIDREDPITVVCAADDKFALPLLVTLFSVMTNLRDGDFAEIYIIDAGISSINRKKISQILAKFDNLVRTVWAYRYDNRISNLMETEHISRATYLRLLVPEILPAGTARAIYLDSDLIVEGSVSELWYTPFHGKSAIGVRDYCFPTVSAPDALPNFESRSIDKDAPFCNAGVIIFNLEVWRTRQIHTRILDYLDQTKQNDQQGINAILMGDWVLLDPSWNVTISSLSMLSSKHLEDPAKINKARESPDIVHYTSEFKPWVTRIFNYNWLEFAYFNQYFFYKFYKYLRMSKWMSPLGFFMWRLWSEAGLLALYKIPRRAKIIVGISS
jgi:lipopolysaccharide biosynthesis glycosyltransferase